MRKKEEQVTDDISVPGETKLKQKSRIIAPGLLSS